MKHEWNEKREKTDSQIYGPVMASVVGSKGEVNGRKVARFRNPQEGETFFAGDRWEIARCDFPVEEARYIAEPEPEWDYVTDGVNRMPTAVEYVSVGIDLATMKHRMLPYGHPEVEDIVSRLCYRRIPKATV